MNPKITLKIVSFVWLLAAGALGGCVAVAAGHVKVLDAAPTVPYVALGKVDNFQVDDITFQGSVSSGDLLEGLREKAAALGADAVIITAHKRVLPTTDHLSEWGTHPGQLVEGIAIRYKKAGGQ